MYGWKGACERVSVDKGSVLACTCSNVELIINEFHILKGNLVDRGKIHQLILTIGMPSFSNFFKLFKLTKDI